MAVADREKAITNETRNVEAPTPEPTPEPEPQPEEPAVPAGEQETDPASGVKVTYDGQNFHWEPAEAPTTAA